MDKTVKKNQDNEPSVQNKDENEIPPFGTKEWIQYWSEFEGHLPSPIDVSITGSLAYKCPELKWYNFDIYPHKVKLTNTGYTGKLEDLADDEDKEMPPYGTREWLQYWSKFEGYLPSPINVSITNSLLYYCPYLKWFNFHVLPHKVKLTNTGYTLLVSVKWRTERPYLVGGPFLDKHVLSQIHFHWGADMTEGSDHIIDNRRHPAEMQVTFFRAEYMTQQEALKHRDGVTMVCYLIRYGVKDDDRLTWVTEGFSRVQQANTSTRVGPQPMSRLMPTFYEDYFFYWGNLNTVNGDKYVIKWLISRANLNASFEQLNAFRSLWDPYDEPNLRNYRPLQNREDRHVFFIKPHWCQYNSLLPVPRLPDLTVSQLSVSYRKNSWMLPPPNRIEQVSYLPFTQSPVNISTAKCPQWVSLEPLLFRGYWNRELPAKLLNNGTTACFTFESDKQPTLQGGPLNAEYKFEQMDFHWSKDDSTGCEHVLDGKGYAAECQLLHYNAEYGSMDEAIGHDDGLAVVGIFLKATAEPNPGFNQLVKCLEHIKQSQVCIKTNADSIAWIGSDYLRENNYVTYRGSLTMPPYTECVTWILFAKSIQIGTKQLAILRQLEGPNQERIKCNIRPEVFNRPENSVIFVKQIRLI